MWRFVLVGLIACGGTAPGPAAPVPASGSAEISTGEEDLKSNPNPKAITPEAACSAFSRLGKAGCADFSRLDAGALCIENIHIVLDDQQGVAFARCAVENEACDQVMACIKGQERAPQIAHAALRACMTPGTSPVGLPQDAYDRRNGATSKELARVTSTQDRPIETCGFDDERAWIEGATCADGSKPAQGKAEAMRQGNIGRAGRCASIIDAYKIPCPEREYAVYVDAYICPQH